MNIFSESMVVFRALQPRQKWILLRIFIVINVAAYVLASQPHFDSDWANIAGMFVIYALENCFMLWLGFKRGMGFHRVRLGGTGALTPPSRKGAGAAWYIGLAAISLLVSVVTGLIVTNLSDDDGLTSGQMIAFFAAEVVVMGFSLLQGLRIGWNAVVVSLDTTSVPSQAGGGGSGGFLASGAISPGTNTSLPAVDDTTAQKRAQNIRRGRMVLGCISVICAGLAIYFHVVAREMAKPDPDSDAAAKGVMQALSDDTASSSNPQTTADAAQGGGQQPNVSAQPVARASVPSMDAVPADNPAIAQALAKVAQVAKEDPNGADYINGEDSDTFELPVYAGRTSSEYPVYAVSCDFQKQQCTFHNAMGNALIIPLTDAANELTPIHNADVVGGTYHCQANVCTDVHGQVVGTVSLEMRNYLAAHQ